TPTNTTADGEDVEYRYQAKALYSYTASEEDPNEISFSKHEILGVVGRQGKWWEAKK
ncbi:hypothetical protein K438DRAFT_1433013, partial [Mycena galopus ATCC 62051]